MLAAVADAPAPTALAEPGPRPLTSSEVAELAGVSLSTVNAWVQAGVVKPSIRAARKGGSASLWAPEDVRTVKLVAELREQLGRQAAVGTVGKAVELSRACGAACLVAIGPNGVDIVRRGMDLRQIIRRVGAPVTLLEPVRG